YYTLKIRNLTNFNYTGDLERLRRYWMTGTCKPEKEVQKRSDPLALEQFLSVFYLLIVGIVFSGMLLIFEILYIEYSKHHQPSHEKRGCHALLNLSLSKSLDFQGSIFDAKNNLPCQCQNSSHDLWRVQYELNLARARIKQLERRLEAYGIESNQNK
ncbi:GSCOCG00011141001-RA-CDS, partial [Cotesia congregata]